MRAGSSPLVPFKRSKSVSADYLVQNASMGPPPFGSGNRMVCRTRLCLVVKREAGYPFILTAYLGRSIKGEGP